MHPAFCCSRNILTVSPSCIATSALTAERHLECLPLAYLAWAPAGPPLAVRAEGCTRRTGGIPRHPRWCPAVHARRRRDAAEGREHTARLALLAQQRKARTSSDQVLRRISEQSGRLTMHTASLQHPVERRGGKARDGSAGRLQAFGQSAGACVAPAVRQCLSRAIH